MSGPFSQTVFCSPSDVSGTGTSVFGATLVGSKPIRQLERRESSKLPPPQPKAVYFYVRNTFEGKHHTAYCFFISSLASYQYSFGLKGCVTSKSVVCALYCWLLLSFSSRSFPVRRFGPLLRLRERRGSLFLPPQEQPPLRQFLAERSCRYRLTPSGLLRRGRLARSSFTCHWLSHCPWQPPGGSLSTPSLRLSGGLLCLLLTRGGSRARRLGLLSRVLLAPSVDAGGCCLYLRSPGVVRRLRFDDDSDYWVP